MGLVFESADNLAQERKKKKKKCLFQALFHNVFKLLPKGPKKGTLLSKRNK